MLWIAPKPPFPERDGATRATGALLRSIVRMATEPVDVVCVRKERALVPTSIEGLRALRSFRSPRRVTALLANAFAARFVVPSFLHFQSSALRNYVGKSPQQVLVIDGLHAAAPWWRSGAFEFPAGKIVVYRSHNIEAEVIDDRRQKAQGAYQFLWELEYRQVRRAELALVQTADHTFAISERDADLHREELGAESCSALEIPYSFEMSTPPLSRREFPFLFLGRLDWEPNREGLRWLLREVWPRVIERAPGIRLHVAGIGDGRYLQEFRALRGLTLLGAVPEVGPLYNEARAALIPIFSGSGVRVKALEAIAYSVPVVSTAKGIEGLSLAAGDHYIESEDPEVWAEALAHWDDERTLEMTMAARDMLQEAHHPDALAKKFLRELTRTLSDA